MDKLAFVFAGQGAQFEGMGSDLYNEFPTVRDVYDRAEQLRPGTIRQSFEAPLPELSVTRNTQPCMYVMESAIALLLAGHGIHPDALAGFSLGEVAAFQAADAFDFEGGLRFILARAEAMDKAATATPGKMAAILRLPAEDVENICSGIANVWAVNYNCPGQTVISGSPDAVDSAIGEVGRLGGKAVLLAVSGAFHSPFMKPASEELHRHLQSAPPKPLGIPVYCNRTGDIADGATLIEQMTLQVQSPVQWTRTIESMKRDGIRRYIEIGPGKVLTGLIRKIDPEAVVTNVQDSASFHRLIQEAEAR